MKQDQDSQTIGSITVSTFAFTAHVAQFSVVNAEARVWITQWQYHDLNRKRFFDQADYF